tara:strand:+ start:15 stop:305 length:291 start_codon:yes stop_codon:yes gene_type:complete
MNKKLYRGPYAGPIEPELLNRIDKDMQQRDRNYWKLGNGFPKSYKASYVSVMMTDPDTGEKTKHMMGPYSKKTAQKVMTDLLAQGECSWVEEDYIK